MSDVGGFDWSDLHSLLAAIPAGSWTTYGDLATVIGTASMPLGQHIAHCPVCPNAHRVLGADGKPRRGFAWTDPTDTRTQEQALSAEGVHFRDGAADPTRRLTATDLEAMADSASGG
jgi:alkylated DNA nucleotide flippase Atl1